MGKKIVLLLLVVVVVLLGLFLVGQRWLSQVSESPSLFPVAEYKLSDNWYLGRFQPVYLWQYDQDGATYFKVLYRGADGSWEVGDVLVGGRYAEVDILWVPFNGKDQEGGGVTSVPDDFDYPLRLGQQFSVMYLLPTGDYRLGELKDRCQDTPRICQVRDVFASYGGKAWEIANENGLEPGVPVIAVGIGDELKTQLP